jgi:hypothetical protein
MKTCKLCKSEKLVMYGDEIYGENFCKDCYEQYRCLHCNKMNIVILFDNKNNIIDVIIKRKYGGFVGKDSILTPMFHVGYEFKLFCKECWETQDVYKNEDEDNISIEPEEDDVDYNYSDDENNEDDDYISSNLNSYYTGKGKHDLY